MLALLFVAFLLALLIGFDVGFSMIFSAWLGVLSKPGEAIDMAMMSLSMISGVDSYALVQVTLFMAGVVPAILMALGFLVVCSIVARYRKYPSREAVGWKIKVRATGRASWALMMPVIIIGGIRFGVLTVTESAALAALYALF